MQKNNIQMGNDHQDFDSELKVWKDRLDRGDITEAVYETTVRRLLDSSNKVTSTSTAHYRPAQHTLVKLIPGMDIGPDNHRFRLECEIGQGAMGRVWKARDLAREKLDGDICYKALKVVAPEYMNAEQALEKLKHEAMRASDLNHPNIINVNSWHQGNDTWLFVEMEYLEGSDLDYLLLKEGEHGLPTGRVFSLLKQMANALDYAHQECSIIHRDLKPGNVFITNKGRIKLLDFGLAHQLRQNCDNRVKADNLGTPVYMPPEAFVEGEPDSKQDIYALACLTYELLTGKPPYSKEEARSRPANLFPPKPEGLTPSAWRVLCQGFAYEQDKRPQSCGQFYQQLCAKNKVQSEEVRQPPIADTAKQQESTEPPKISGSLETNSKQQVGIPGTPDTGKGSYVKLVIGMLIFIGVVVTVGFYQANLPVAEPPISLTENEVINLPVEQLSAEEKITPSIVTASPVNLLDETAQKIQLIEQDLASYKEAIDSNTVEAFEHYLAICKVWGCLKKSDANEQIKLIFQAQAKADEQKLQQQELATARVREAQKDKQRKFQPYIDGFEAQLNSGSYGEAFAALKTLLKALKQNDQLIWYGKTLTKKEIDQDGRSRIVGAYLTLMDRKLQNPRLSEKELNQVNRWLAKAGQVQKDNLGLKRRRTLLVASEQDRRYWFGAEEQGSAEAYREYLSRCQLCGWQKQAEAALKRVIGS